MKLSAHCRIRMAQRGFSENMLKVVLKYGEESKKNNVLSVNLGQNNLSCLKGEIKALEGKINYFEAKIKDVIAKKCLFKESKSDFGEIILLKSRAEFLEEDPLTRLDEALINYRRKIKSYKKRINEIRHLIDKADVELLQKNNEIITVYKRNRHTF